MFLVRGIFSVGPLLFGIGFLAPLIAQVLQQTAAPAPFGLSPLLFGLLIGGALGLVATLRGRWL